jgi:DNA-binding CsgD family transcriptional regulator
VTNADALHLGKPLLSALDRTACGGVILDETGHVLALNVAAQRLLNVSLRDGSDHDLSAEDARSALKGLLRAGDTRFTLDQDTWAVVEREDQRQLVLHSILLNGGNNSALPSTNHPVPHTMVILIDLERWPQPSAATLQKMFALTPAEAKLAILISRGEQLADVAESCGVSISTARTQLASIFAKTHTKRQAELVALLARVAILP